MGLDDTTEPQVVARNITRDDPTWGQVAAFLDAADSAYADTPSPTQQAVHLAAISQAFYDDAPQRNQPMSDPHSRQRGRTALGAMLAAFVLISGGVTAASAFGALTLFPTQDPLQGTAPILMDAAADPVDTDTGEEGDDADEDSAAKPKPAGNMHAVNTRSESSYSAPSGDYSAPKQTTTHHDDDGEDESSHHEDHEDHEDESDD